MTFPLSHFKNGQKMNPNLSSFIILGRIIAEWKPPRFYVGKWLLQHVDKRDYDERDVEDLIRHFVGRTMA